ncbi:DUF3987 domain-containing protein [Hymenobacter terrigena]
MHKRLVSDQYAKATADIRALVADTPQRKQIKLALDNVTVAGEFSKRAAANLLTRSGLLVLDFDHVRNLRGLRRHLLRDPVLGPSVMLLFISPSGDGLKAVVAVDIRFDHKCSFDAIVAHLRATCPRWFKQLDLGASDISRGCLLCHDPDAYLNPDYLLHIPFPQDLSDLFEACGNPFSSLPPTNNEATRLETWIRAVEASTDFPDDYDCWYRIGLALASLGEEGRQYFHRVSRMSPKYNEAECDRQFSLSMQKGSGAITVGTFVHICQEVGLRPDDTPSNDEPHEDGPTPCLPDGLFPQLPMLLQKGCTPFRTDRERDVMLVGMLTVLSGCFPTLTGLYRGKVIGANVYAFIVAPAASGKGALDWARLLAWPHHLTLREASNRAWQEYEEELETYERAKRAAKRGDPLPAKPEQPPRRRLFIAADNGAANLIKTLAENEEHGILFETEADTLSGTLKQDFGDYSALLRKASEHEPHLYDRKTAGTYELSRPSLSVVLSGTPEQVNRLIPSAENGLFSRFWFYSFHAPHEWDDPFADGGEALDDIMNTLSAQVSTLIMQAAATSIRMKLTSEQESRFNAKWVEWLRMGIADFGEGSGSAVKRHGRACFRLCMLLTLLRSFENGEFSSNLVCSDEDFASALSIADIFRQHALRIYQHMLQHADRQQVPSRKYLRAEQEVEAHRLKAQGLSIRLIASRLSVPKTTVQNWLSSKQSTP